MKKVLGLAVVIIAALLLISQLQFSSFGILQDDGYAVSGNSILKTLLADPQKNQNGEILTLEKFKAEDVIFKQQNRLYLGDPKKVELNLTFPLFINDSLALQTLNNEAVLYDEAFEQVDTYEGMILKDGAAFNKNRERADAANYLFLQLSNGLYMNLLPFQITMNDETYNMEVNSIMNLTETYISYLDIADGEATYSSLNHVDPNSIVQIGETECTYQELLTYLHVIAVENAENMQVQNEEEKDEEIGNIPLETGDELTGNAEAETENTDVDSQENKEKATKSTIKSNQTAREEETEPSTGITKNIKPGKTSTVYPSGSDGNQVRPDYMRPDKTKNDDTPEQVVDYQKPVVSVEAFTATVYKLEGHLSVNDPANRINSRKKIQFSFYVGDTLKFRIYRTDTSDVVVGDGLIEPSTTYHVIGQFTYNDEYNKEVVEQITDQTITTKGVDTLGPIYLQHSMGTSYSTAMELTNIGYTEESDREAVYGIGDYPGMSIAVPSANNLNLSVTKSSVREFKNGTSITYKSMEGLLKSSTDYPYAIHCYDYFGNELQVINNTGTYKTSKMHPTSSISIEQNEIGNMEAAIYVTNVDGVEMQNLTALIKNEDGTVVGDPYPLALDESQKAVITATELDLETKYYIQVICDYDVDNGLGLQKDMTIGQSMFTSATLSDLGKVYIANDILEIKDTSASLTFTLNTAKTNDFLENLLSAAQIDIVKVSDEGEETENPVKTLSFTQDEITLLKSGGTVSFSNDRVSGLESMTTYHVKISVYAEYLGKSYQMRTALTKTEFKTMKKDPEVIVTNLIAKAGHIIFDAAIQDTDETVLEDYVTINLYKNGNTFVQAVRVKKNKEAVTINFSDIDEDATYTMYFIAKQYNNGYSIGTLKSNFVIESMDVNSESGISGSIKLQGLDAISGNNAQYNAHVNVTVEDLKNELSPKQFYLRVEKDGAVLEDNSYTMPDNLGSRQFVVDKGNYTYSITLYVKIQGYEIPLDVCEFTSEQVIIGIANGYEFVTKIKAAPSAKFIVLNDISISSDSSNVVPNSTAKFSGANIVTTFNGSVDFQGYSLNHTVCANGQRLFVNLGPKGTIKNFVYNIRLTNTNILSYDGGLVYRNYGKLQNFMIHFKGGTAVENNNYGLLVYLNCSTGNIENFVVNTTPDDGQGAYTINSYGGCIARTNQGKIRQGYVYGADINCMIGTNTADRHTGGIVAVNGTLGVMERIYSLINVSSNLTYPSTYTGSIAGQNSGIVRNVYGVKDATPVNKAVGPVVGFQDSRSSTLAYYVSDNVYTNTYNTKVSAESIYDSIWHKDILGTSFRVDTVDLGYYPQITLPSCMPEQEWLPLPEKETSLIVDITNSVVLEYKNNGNEAVVEFRLSNPKEVTIDKINIAGLEVTIDPNSVVNYDGYTTLRATLSNPQVFYSEYQIQSLVYTLGSKQSTVKFEGTNIRTVEVEFYRGISTAAEWYDYVVSKGDENVKLLSDIDFSNVQAPRISVQKQFSGKLDGNNHAINHIDLASNTTSNYVYNVLFKSISQKAVIKNLTVNHYECGGSYQSGNKVITYSNIAMVGTSSGTIQNVHILDMKANGNTYLGGMVAYSQYGSMQDCSVTDAVITYQESTGSNSTAYVGGLAGFMDRGSISNCYIQDFSITANDFQNSEGIGGLAGYLSYSGVSDCYAIGDIEARGYNVGGLIGKYTADESTIQLDTIYADVNIITYQDYAGGLIGTTNIGSIPDKNMNCFGLAYGNIYSYNTESINISQTIGKNKQDSVTFYGTRMQLLNGIVTDNASSSVCTGLLSYEEITNPNTYTNAAILNFNSGFAVSCTADGYLPKVYYADGSGLLPYQRDHTIDATESLELSITDIYVDTNAKIITFEVYNPQRVRLSGVDISYLNADFYGVDYGTQGTDRIYYQYGGIGWVPDKYYDSYVATAIRYKLADSDTASLSYPIYARIPLTLYQEIANIQDWNTKIRPDAYENYKIIRNIDFSGQSFQTNIKIGRMIGDNGGSSVTLSNIEINASSENLIHRISSGIQDINFSSCTVITKDRISAGLIGYSAGAAKRLKFTDIEILCTTAHNNVGIIGFQSGGSLESITLQDIKVSASKSQSNTGGLCGYISDGTVMSGITGKNIVVQGYNYCGGLFGNGSYVFVDGVALSDITVTGGGTRVGGLAGMIGDGSNRYSSVKNVTLTGNRSEDGKTSTTTITGAGTCVGGLIGYNFAYLDGNNRIIPRILVSGVVVSSSSNMYIGGIVGLADWSYLGHYKYCKIEDSYIQSTGSSVANYVGGFDGYTYANINNCMADNIQIYTKNAQNVGGITGYQAGNVTNYCTIKNSQIQADAGSNIGGLIGNNVYSGASYNGVVNCTVDAPNCDNVGGIAGNSSYALEHNFCYAAPQNTSDTIGSFTYAVTGKTNVGGIVGYLNDRSAGWNYSNAQIIGKSNVGGLVGAYRNNYVTTTKADGSLTKTYSYAALYYNFFAGTVEATGSEGFAGGAIGNVLLNTTAGGRSVSEGSGAAEESTYTLRNLILPTSVTASGTSGTANLFAGNNKNFTGYYTRAWEGTEVNGVYTGDMKGENGASLYPVWKSTTATSSISTITSTDLSDINLYKNIIWKNGNYNNWFDLTGIAEYLPKLLTTQTGSTLIDAQVNIKIPKFSGLKMMTLASLASSGESVSVYPVDADKINLEFGKNTEDGAYFMVVSDGKILEQQLITQRVYTCNYDYQTNFEIYLGYADVKGFEEWKKENPEQVTESTRIWDYSDFLYLQSKISVYPDDLTRKIMVWNKDYYYIADDGIRSSQSEMAGNFLNLYNGCALDGLGNIWDVAAANIVGQAPAGISLNEDTVPIFDTEYNGYRINAYAGFSQIIGLSTITQELQVFAKGNNLNAIDGSMETVKDAVLVYTLNNTEHLTVLGIDGQIVDLKSNDLMLPEDFDNSGIAYMTNNLSSTVPYALVEYANGGIAGFNYTTGESLFTYNMKENISLPAFAVRFFSSESLSLYNDVSYGYDSNKAISDEITGTDDLAAIVGSSVSGTNTESLLTGETDSNTAEDTSLAIKQTTTEDDVNLAEASEDTTTETTSTDTGEADTKEEVVSTNEEVVTTDVAEEATESSVEEDSTATADVAETESSTVTIEETDSTEDTITNTATENTEEAAITSGITESEVTGVDSEMAGETAEAAESAVTATDSETIAEEEEADAENGDTVAAESNPETTETSVANGELTTDVTADSSGTTTSSVEMQTLFVPVYNAEKGYYEIVNVTELLNNEKLISENDKIGVQDFSAFYGFAEKQQHSENANGLVLYILVACGIISGVAYMIYRKTTQRNI